MKTIKTVRLTVILSLILSPAVRADITITGTGVVSIGNSSTIHFGGGTLSVGNGAQLKIQVGGTLTGSAVVVGPSGKLFNCGTVNAAISNAGEIVSDCGVDSVFLGTITNNGIFRISHGSTLIASGGFHNSPGALLDMITAAQTGPPPSLSGSGAVIEAADVRIEGIQVGDLDAQIAIHGIPPHTYQLMGSSDLSTPLWTPIGPTKVATGGHLQWVHSGVAISFDRYFYRVIVGDQ